MANNNTIGTYGGRISLTPDSQSGYNDVTQALTRNIEMSKNAGNTVQQNLNPTSVSNSETSLRKSYADYLFKNIYGMTYEQAKSNPAITGKTISTINGYISQIHNILRNAAGIVERTTNLGRNDLLNKSISWMPWGPSINDVNNNDPVVQNVLNDLKNTNNALNRIESISNTITNMGVIANIPEGGTPDTNVQRLDNEGYVQNYNSQTNTWEMEVDPNTGQFITR